MALSIQNLSEPLLAKIIGYAGIGDEQYEFVCKVFDAARQKAMQVEWKEGLLLSRSITAVTPGEIKKLEKEIHEKAQTHFPPKEEIRIQWADYLNFRNCSQAIYKLASGLPDPIPAQARARRQEHLREVSRMFDQLPVNFKEIARVIHEFNAKEGLALKERTIAIVPGAYENPKLIGVCFRVLQQTQRTEASETFQGRMDLKKIPRGLSLQRNLAVERVIQKVRAEMDNNLFLVWQSIRATLNPLPAGVPDAGANPPLIRAWLNDPINQPHLDKIWLLSTHRITAIPREIVKLRYLTNLIVDGVRELPAFLSELRYLNRCTVNDTGLRLYSISDAFYRHMECTLYCWEGEVGNILASVNNTQEIPFRMWFKREYTIGHNAFTFAAFDCFNDWLKSEFDPDVAECLFEIGIRLGSPIFVAIMAFDLLFNITAFLLNLLLIDCVEPVITFARDRLGYSRMVKPT